MDDVPFRDVYVHPKILDGDGNDWSESVLTFENPVAQGDGSIAILARDA